MNTIPTIFNERKIRHTIVGGKGSISDCRESARTPLGVILLNRGGRYYRSAVFQSLLSFGFESIVSVELTTETYDIENLSLRFPGVRFLIPQEKVSIGDMINMGISELESEFVLIIWNDVKLSPGSFPSRLLEKLAEEKPLCLTPLLTNQKMQTLPVQMIPAVQKTSMQVTPSLCTGDGAPTVYPFDFMGIYNREKFIRLGGFDYTITTEYWQNMDFGFRGCLWGEDIKISTLFRLMYESEVPAEDITPDRAHLRFYLKNIAPQFKMDHCILPLSKFPAYLRSSNSGPFDGWKEFSNARQWVDLNKYRFVRDAKNLIELWESA